MTPVGATRSPECPGSAAGAGADHRRERAGRRRGPAPAVGAVGPGGAQLLRLQEAREPLAVSGDVPGGDAPAAKIRH